MVPHDSLTTPSEVGSSGPTRSTESVRSKKDKVCDHCIEAHDEQGKRVLICSF